MEIGFVVDFQSDATIPKLDAHLNAYERRIREMIAEDRAIARRRVSVAVATEELLTAGQPRLAEQLELWKNVRPETTLVRIGSLITALAGAPLSFAGEIPSDAFVLRSAQRLVDPRDGSTFIRIRGLAFWSHGELQERIECERRVEEYSFRALGRRLRLLTKARANELPQWSPSGQELIGRVRRCIEKSCAEANVVPGPGFLSQSNEAADPAAMLPFSVTEPAPTLPTSQILKLTTTIIESLGLHRLPCGVEMYSTRPRPRKPLRSRLPKMSNLLPADLSGCVLQRLTVSLQSPFGCWQTVIDASRAPDAGWKIAVAAPTTWLRFALEVSEGWLPFWLAPEQVRLLPTHLAQQTTAVMLARKLQERGFRVGIDASSDRLGKRVRRAIQSRAAILAVVGPREAAADTVSWKPLADAARGAGVTCNEPIDQFVERLYLWARMKP